MKFLATSVAIGGDNCLCRFKMQGARYEAKAEVQLKNTYS